MRVLTNIVEHARTALIRVLAPSSDFIRFQGLIRACELPGDCTREDFTEWWPRLSLKEREKWVVYEHKNTLTSAGRTQLLTYIASQNPVTGAFGQYFAVGAFQMNGVSPGDTAVQAEFYRTAPSAAMIIGTQLDLSMYIGPNEANNLYFPGFYATNAGLYGLGATSVLGSGTLLTHSIFNYQRNAGVNQAIGIDYYINLM